MYQIENKETGEVTNYTDEQFIAERDKRLLQWQEAQTALATAKDKELELRKLAVEFSFDQNKDKGTERIELGNGYQAKAVKKINYGFVKNEENKTDKDAIESALEKIEADGPTGELIAERLISWSPSLSQSEYKNLCPEHKEIIDEVIVTTAGAPTLEIIPPKS